MNRQKISIHCEELLEAMPMPSAIVNNEGYIIRTNSLFERHFFTLTQDTITTKITANPLFPGRNILQSYMDNKGLLNPPYQTKFLYNFSESIKKWINLNITSIGDKIKPLFLFCFQDQTEQTSTEIELQQSRERYREAQSIANLGHWHYRFKTGNFTISRETARLFNLIQEFEENTEIKSLITNAEINDKKKHELHEKTKIAINNKSTFDELIPLKINGDLRHYHILGQLDYNLEGFPEKAIGTVQDATAKRLAENKLRESELRKTAILNSIPDLMFLLSSDGYFKDYHCSNKDFPLKHPELYLGLYLDKFQDNDLHEILRDGIDKVLNYSEYIKFEHTYQTEEELFHFEFRMAPAGKDEILLIIRDISTTANLEKMLAQSHRMQAVGRLAGGIAHDFNNMLQVIIGYGEIIQNKNPNEEISTIMAAAEKGRTLIKQLLSFSRMQIMLPKATDLNQTIKGIGILLERLIGEDIEMEMSLAENIPMIYADNGQMEQVLMNLSINARDAIIESGKIIIKTSTQTITEENLELIPHLAPGKYVKLSISDTGIGIKPELLDKVFDPFFTTKETADSSGLGLSTVYAIIKRHNGYIQLSSRINEGTTAIIYLPTSSAENTDIKNQDKINNYDKGGETILIAEDNELVRKMTADILKQAGYRLISTADGQEAVNEWNKNRNEIKLLLFDVVMPVLNGQKAYDAIAKEDNKIPILFFSGYSEDILKQEYLAKIPGKLLQKPTPPNVLLATVRELLDKYQ